MKLLANLVCFQLVWMVTVGGAAQGLWWAGPVAAALFAAWQVPLSPAPRADLKLMAIAAVAGFLVDTALVLGGLLVFETPVPWESAAPIWIVALWVAFALTLNHSMDALKRRPVLAVLLGLIGGPLAYWVAAHVWHAVDLNGSALLSLAVIGAVWAVLTPSLLALAERLKREPRAV
ncbi:DUF2878 domain-containing protein [Aquimonas voraii]|uniref:DUF2878 domain-containing protein n=1 Tax=Aquimonas voraii TaxID=265719 RepID=A0A1G6YWP4_9GAMM|nr:DUF2878 domain-containing protein [Aquimonas voraii]SDD94731.1 Protein of unknown function [Aquimonas voraii]